VGLLGVWSKTRNPWKAVNLLAGYAELGLHAGRFSRNWAEAKWEKWLAKVEIPDS